MRRWSPTFTTRVFPHSGIGGHLEKFYRLAVFRDPVTLKVFQFVGGRDANVAHALDQHVRKAIRPDFDSAVTQPRANRGAENPLVVRRRFAIEKDVPFRSVAFETNDDAVRELLDLDRAARDVRGPHDVEAFTIVFGIVKNRQILP